MAAYEHLERLTRFDSLAPSYERWFTSAIGGLVDRTETALLARLVAARPHEVVLEVGSGTGHFLRGLAQTGASCVGLDPSSEMLSIAASADNHGTSLVKGCGEALPFAAAAFDCVAFVTTLEFVNDAEEAIREAVRVSRPGGRLVFVVLNGRGPWYSRRMAEGGLWAETRFYTAEELRGLLSPYGAVTLDYCAHIPPRLGGLPSWALVTVDALYRMTRKEDGALIGARVDLGR